ncbi:MAG: GTPase Era [Bacteriovoracaceae bacterium]|nr:GTPase Era [Bacteriovoracaceae bacterium]
MLIEDQHPANKILTVAVLGEPNAGKSTLINRLLGMDLAVVTNRPQTTRNHYQCVLHQGHTEIILIDTPGMHRSNQEINKRMNEEAREGTQDTQVQLLLIDAQAPIQEQVEMFKTTVERDLPNVWLVFTKADLLANPAGVPWEEFLQQAQKLLPGVQRYFVLSAKSGYQIDQLLDALMEAAQPGRHRFKEGEVSNKNLRFFVCEYIREQAFYFLQEELPYELAVVIDEYHDYAEHQEKSKLAAHISATIIVNRPSQRGIVVGRGGAMIKKIGTHAREKIEALVGGQVHLNLHVKVIPRWFKNNHVLEEIGLFRAPDSNRVWRKS